LQTTEYFKSRTGSVIVCMNGRNGDRANVCVNEWYRMMSDSMGYLFT